MNESLRSRSRTSIAKTVGAITALIVAVAGLVNGANDLVHAVRHDPTQPQEKTNAVLLQKHFSTLPLTTQTVTIKQSGVALDMVFDIYDNGDIHVRYGTVEQWFPAKELQFAHLSIISAAYAQELPGASHPPYIQQSIRAPITIDLNSVRAEKERATGPSGPTAAVRSGPTVSRVFLIAQTKDDHPSPFAQSSKQYQQVFYADPGYVIVSHELRIASQSSARAISADVIENRSAVRVTYTLASGPTLDRYRGWIKGTLETTQVKDH